MAGIRFLAIAAAAMLAAPAAADLAEDCTQPADRALGLSACAAIIGDTGASATARAQAHYNRGKHLQAGREHAAAIADFDAALTLAPDDPLALNNRGLSHHRLRSYDDALADFGRAIALDPNRPIPHNNRGNTHARMGDHEAAVADYDRAISLNPYYAKAHNGRANALCALGRHQASSESRLRALELGAMNTASVQRALARYGFLRGEPTGILDPDTEAALRTWSLAGCPRD